MGARRRNEIRLIIAVRQLAEHYNKPPDKITDEELRQYFLPLKTDKKWRHGMTLYGHYNKPPDQITAAELRR
jgi:hypothetical protein